MHDDTAEAQARRYRALRRALLEMSDTFDKAMQDACGDATEPSELTAEQFDAAVDAATIAAYPEGV